MRGQNYILDETRVLEKKIHEKKASKLLILSVKKFNFYYTKYQKMSNKLIMPLYFRNKFSTKKIT